MHRCRILTTSLALLAVLPLLASSLSAQELRVGVVDIRRVARESRTGQASLERIRQLGERLKADIKQRQQAYQQEIQRFQERALTMDAARRAERQDELERKGIDIQRAAEDARREIAREGQKIEEETRTEVREVLQEFARQEGYDLVFDVQQCLYNAPTTDITEALVRFYDQRSAGGR